MHCAEKTPGGRSKHGPSHHGACDQYPAHESIASHLQCAPHYLFCENGSESLIFFPCRKAACGRLYIRPPERSFRGKESAFRLWCSLCELLLCRHCDVPSTGGSPRAPFPQHTAAPLGLHLECLGNTGLDLGGRGDGALPWALYLSPGAGVLLMPSIRTLLRVLFTSD